MTFGEDFPSLKGITNVGTPGEIFRAMEEDVKKHCLDKKKVKEAIEKYAKLSRHTDEPLLEEIKRLDALKKELGL